MELFRGSKAVFQKLMVAKKEEEGIIMLRRMMLLCCLFDDNYEFEREKLQQLWIAGSFLSKEPLEYHAQQYFDIMLEKNHIVLSRVDIFTGTKMYKVDSNKLNDALSLMQQPIKDFQMRLEGNDVCINSYDNCQHVSLLRENIDQPTFESLKRFKKLKTLLFLNGSSIKHLPTDLFSTLKSLTSIDLSGSCITKLPSSIGEVKELCFLDLSWTPIKKLPECIVGLQMLQTLRLKECKRLFKLPTEMNKLVNLRHLDFDIIGQLDDMPRGIGSLVVLCTLTGFIVGVDDEGRCNIIELKHMDNLSGKIYIYGLELVTDANDAKAATLGSKDLKQLELRWNDTVQMENGKNICDEVLACLKPNYGLEELQITCFPGLSLPSWIGDPSFAYLVSITLYKCENCKVLPSLGRLPKLKTLDIVEMNGVKAMDDMMFEAFPRLETLCIDGMLGLESLVFKGCPCLVKLSVTRCPKLTEILSLSHLGCLRHLEVTYCRWFQYLPPQILASPLQSLAIDACPLLEKRLRKGGPDHTKIQHVPDLWIGVDDADQSTDEDSESDDEDFHSESDEY